MVLHKQNDPLLPNAIVYLGRCCSRIANKIKSLEDRPSVITAVPLSLALVSTMDFSNVAFEVEVSVVANVTRSRVVGLERELETERKGNVLWLGSRTEEYGGKNDSTFAISVHMTTKSVRDDVIVR